MRIKSAPAAECLTNHPFDCGAALALALSKDMRTAADFVKFMGLPISFALRIAVWYSVANRMPLDFFQGKR